MGGMAAGVLGESQAGPGGIHSSLVYVGDLLAAYAKRGVGCVRESGIRCWIAEKQWHC